MSVWVTTKAGASFNAKVRGSTVKVKDMGFVAKNTRQVTFRMICVLRTPNAISFRGF